MNILLINPPYNRLKGIREFYFPIGLGYLATMLNKTGYNVRVYNMDAPTKKENVVKYKDEYSMQMKSHRFYLAGIEDKNNVVWSELKYILKKFNPDLIAITATSSKFQSAIKVAEVFKESNKKGLVIIGGAHPTICPDETIKNEFVDFIVKGEGEKTIVELCDYIKNKKVDFSKIDGISYKRKGKIIHNKGRDLIENLDEFPSPAKNLLIFPERYNPSLFGAIISMRGCPFRCGFCAAKCMWGIKVRTRSVENVIKEIKDVTRNFGTKEFFFWDDSFTIKRNRTIELCKAIIKNRLNIVWGCSTRVTLLDEALIKLMKKAGCSSIELGVETGSEKMLKIIKKDITIKQVRDTTKLLRKHRISYTLMLMAGFPEETKEDIEQTIKFIKQTKHGFFCFSVFTPYPGTELYDTAKKLNLIPQNIDWSNLSHHSPENYFLKYIPKEDFKKYVKEINKLVDNHNKSFLRKLEYINARLNFYTKNPSIFVKRTIKEIRRK